MVAAVRDRSRSYKFYRIELVKLSVTNHHLQTEKNSMTSLVGWQLIVYHTVIQVFNIKKSGEPEYLARFLNVEGRNGRIIIPHTKLSLAKSSFCYRGSENWNCLPETLRNCAKIGAFKVGLKRWVCQNISRFPDWALYECWLNSVIRLGWDHRKSLLQSLVEFYTRVSSIFQRLLSSTSQFNKDL